MIKFYVPLLVPIFVCVGKSDKSTTECERTCQGCRNGRFGKTVVLLSPAENRRKFCYCILPTETRDFAPQPPEIDENDEMAGHPDKMTVCQKHRFSATKMTGRPGQVSTTFCFSALFWSFPPKTPPHLGIGNSHKRVP